MDGVKVLLLTAFPLVGRLLAEGLEQQDPTLQVVPVRPAGDVVEQVRRSRAAALVVDMGLPGRELRALLHASDDGTCPPVVLLADAVQADVVLDALEAGAAGVVLRDGGLEEAARQVRAAVARVPAVPERLFGDLLATMVQRRRQARAKSTLLERLSARETEVLDLLVEGADHRAIAAALVISPQTARTHIARILAKLEVHSRLEAVALAVRLQRAVPRTPA